MLATWAALPGDALNRLERYEPNVWRIGVRSWENLEERVDTWRRLRSVAFQAPGRNGLTRCWVRAVREDSDMVRS